MSKFFKYCFYFFVLGIFTEMIGAIYGLKISDIFYLKFNYQKDKENLEKYYHLSIKNKLLKEDYPNKWLNNLSLVGNVDIEPENSQYFFSRLIDPLKNEISKVPLSVIKDNLDHIYLLKHVKPNGISIGGAYSVDKRSIYLASRKSSGLGEKKSYLKKAFHHEFSSLLMLNYQFNQIAWGHTAGEKFLYRAEENPLYILDQLQGKQALVDIKFLLKRGLLNEYADTGIENDFNTYAEVIFTDPGRIKKLIKKYPIVQRKYRVFKAFYLSVDPGFLPVFDEIDG